MTTQEQSPAPRHTPGPWVAKVTKAGLGGGYQGVDGPRGQRVALCDEDISLPPKEREANARLIAAAPDLLAFVQDIYGPLAMGRTLASFDTDKMMSIVRALIAQATGGAL